MADDITTAESSPAESQSTTPAEVANIPTDPAAYAEWRQTGKLPDEKPKPSKREASASSKSSVDEESESIAPVSETGNHRRQERTNAEGRIKELLAERNAARAELEALKAGKPDGKAASSPAAAKDAKAESSPASEALQRPVKPKQDDFDSWDQYEAAQDKYLEDLADWKAAERIAQQEQKQRQDAAAREMETRLNEAKSRYGEEAEPKIIETAQTIFQDQGVPPAIKTALGRSDVLVDALYVMGSDTKEMSAFLDLAKKDPLEALRKWFTVEALVKEELGRTPKAEAGTPSRGSDGKFLPERPVKRSAPAPPVELNGNSSPPGDESERAANSDNFRAFKEARDRKDLLRLRGQ